MIIILMNLDTKKVKNYERQIDQLIYKLYGLSEEEIKLLNLIYE